MDYGTYNRTKCLMGGWNNTIGNYNFVDSTDPKLPCAEIPVEKEKSKQNIYTPKMAMFETSNLWRIGYDELGFFVSSKIAGEKYHVEDAISLGVGDWLYQWLLESGFSSKVCDNMINCDPADTVSGAIQKDVIFKGVVLTIWDQFATKLFGAEKRSLSSSIKLIGGGEILSVGAQYVMKKK